MTTAVFRILKAGPLVSFQDGGRVGNMRFGVPASGPMDYTSFATANRSLGNLQNQTAIEVSMGGLQLECLSGAISLSLVGAGFISVLDGVEEIASRVFNVKAGQILTIKPGEYGSWCYLGFSGVPSVRKWLGHAATHLQSDFGAGTLRQGQEFSVEKVHNCKAEEREIKHFKHRDFDGYARVVLGPQDQHFPEESISDFLGSKFQLTSRYDRMGMKLDGKKIEMDKVLSIPSEPIIKGSVQVAGDGMATVLLADHQTTGGYPKIATIISSDIDQIAQLRPRSQLRFKAVEPEDAIKIARVHAIELRYYLDSL